MRVVGTGLVLLLGVVGCGLDAGDGKAGSRPPPPVQPGPECAALNAKAVSCGLALPGTTLPCDEPEDQPARCSLDCFAQTSCDELRTLACHQGPDQPTGPVFACIEACGNQPFVCGSGDLISSRSECDGFADCPDGTDEQSCNLFVCASGGGEIPDFTVCDGVEQCPRGDDELGCFFECDGGTFFKGARCDGFEDCSDGIDERGCPIEADPICN